MSVPRVVLDVYAEADFLARQGIPYHLGGGHPDMLIGGGLDCSSAVSRGLEWKAHLLGERVALDTWGLERWGLPGEGQWMTVWTINHRDDIEHCVLEFKIPGRHRWFAGRYTGTLIGWLTKGFDPTGYTPRRRQA